MTRVSDAFAVAADRSRGAMCASCRRIKPFAELLRVTSRHGDSLHFVCRPGNDGQDTAANCFRRGTCWAGHHRIEFA